MDEIKDRYYELDELISTIDMLKKQLSYQDIIEKLETTKSEYFEEWKSLEEKVYEIEKQEKKEQKLRDERDRW